MMETETLFLIARRRCGRIAAMGEFDVTATTGDKRKSQYKLAKEMGFKAEWRLQSELRLNDRWQCRTNEIGVCACCAAAVAEKLSTARASKRRQEAI